MSTAAAIVALSIPRDYGYVLLTASASYWLTMWHGMRIGHYRKASGVPYPHAYAPYDKAAVSAKGPNITPEQRANYLFNCAVRSQANFLETYPSVLAALLISGLQYPVVASAIGVFWMACRVLYTTGYTDPNVERGMGRARGAGHYLAQAAIYALAGVVGWNVLRA